VEKRAYSRCKEQDHEVKKTRKRKEEETKYTNTEDEKHVVH
jgi:hypothetical protein